MRGLIQSFTNDLSSRTISWILFVGALVVFPDFRDFVVQIFELLPESLEDSVKDYPIPELVGLASAYYGRKHVRAKV